MTDFLQQLLFEEGYVCGTTVKIYRVLGETVGFGFLVEERSLKFIST